MKVYITGIAGFLGSNLAEFFLNNGWEVSGCDSLVGGELSNVPSGATCAILDMNDIQHLKTSLEIIQPDLVIHCACTAYEGLSVFSPAYVTQNTFGITLNLLSCIVQLKIPRLVHCSSMARYGNKSTVKYYETMVPAPVDPYGIAKVAAEDAIRALANIHGFEYTILVPHNIYGPKQKFDDPYRNVAAIMVNKMLQNIPPVIYGDGKQTRCFSYIGDVGPMIYQIATHSEFRSVCHREIFNIGPDKDPITINRLAVTIAEAIGVKPSIIYMPDRPAEVKHAVCSSNKIRYVFNYTQKVFIEEGIKELIAYVKAIGPRPFNYHLPVEITNSPLIPKHWITKGW